jgi:hypothetical protein
MSASSLQRRLNEAGLTWLRRRRKSLVPAAHRSTRLEWAAWILKKTCTTLNRFAFTDGTVFYLARSVSEQESKVRAALGPFIWRQTSGSDGLYEECIGPSGYHKAQGTMVRVWGLLVAGVLFITVMPEGQPMNRWWYEWVVNTRFPIWLQAALGDNPRAFLFQDHERCLWSEEPRAAMKPLGISLLKNYPKCSQDLNPIETAWRELRARLNDTEPGTMEDRESLVRRLRAAVKWVNKNRAECLQRLCASSKERARDAQGGVIE